MGRVERFVLDYLKEYDRGWGYAESIAERYAKLNNTKPDSALVSVKRAIKNLVEKCEAISGYKCHYGHARKLIVKLPHVAGQIDYDSYEDYSKVPELVYQYLREQMEGKPIYFSLHDIAEYIGEKLGKRFVYENKIYEKTHMGYYHIRTTWHVEPRGLGNKIRDTLYDFRNKGLIEVEHQYTPKRLKIEMIYRTDRFYG